MACTQKPFRLSLDVSSSLPSQTHARASFPLRPIVLVRPGPSAKGRGRVAQPGMGVGVSQEGRGRGGRLGSGHAWHRHVPESLSTDRSPHGSGYSLSFGRCQVHPKRYVSDLSRPCLAAAGLRLLTAGSELCCPRGSPSHRWLLKLKKIKEI